MNTQEAVYHNLPKGVMPVCGTEKLFSHSFVTSTINGNVSTPFLVQFTSNSTTICLYVFVYIYRIFCKRDTRRQ